MGPPSPPPLLPGPPGLPPTCPAPATSTTAALRPPSAPCSPQVRSVLRLQPSLCMWRAGKGCRHVSFYLAGVMGFVKLVCISSPSYQYYGSSETAIHTLQPTGAAGLHRLTCNRLMCRGPEAAWTATYVSSPHPAAHRYSQRALPCVPSPLHKFTYPGLCCLGHMSSPSYKYYSSSQTAIRTLQPTGAAASCG